ncbi:MAG: hypothetical protein M1816_006627 [Peltula sp. TS41687]|nr:MAG: hypothetical protein M1816_006627 [Peltula sp. TS41687]
MMIEDRKPHQVGSSIHSSDHDHPNEQESPVFEPIRRQLTSTPDDGQREQATKPTHQRFVFADPVAFRYLEEESSITVLERRQSLPGYDLYVVEQWACSRAHPTFVIVTFTGDYSHTVTVGVLSIPTDQNAWSPRLRLYFKAMSQYHAREKETHLGILMVTNLTSFPSALTVILVPDGDIKKHRENFIINEDLKRLGCSGRASLNLSSPSDATKSKFYQLYKASDRIPLPEAVVEIVRLCQAALMLFGTLDAEYADGLLCDFTERAVNDWWSVVGSALYGLEPRDGILGPTTVAGILGLLMGARNRLAGYGAPVPKDPFEVGTFKRGIAQFQKSQKLRVSKILDRATLEILYEVTAKAASGDNWMVPKTVKTTMAELSGKGGEMVMGMVAAKDKPGIAEMETLSLEKFIQLAYGERCRWLWYGKPRKTVPQDPFGNVDGFDLPLARKNPYSDYMSSGTRSDTSRHSAIKGGTERRSMESTATSRYSPNSWAGLSTESLGDKDSQLRRNLFKSRTGRRNDARSGFERIKDAVGISGLRGHHHRPSRDDTASPEVGGDTLDSADSPLVEPDVSPVQSDLSSEQISPRKQQYESTEKTTPITARMERLRRGRESVVLQPSKSDVGSDSPFTSDRSPLPLQAEVKTQHNPYGTKTLNTDLRTNSREHEFRHSADMQVPSPQSTKENEDIDPPPAYEDDVRCKADLLMQRRQSWSDFVAQRHERRNPRRWPRHVSFSGAEESIHRWRSVTLEEGEEEPNTVEGDELAILAKERALSIEAKRRYNQILKLREQLVPWVQQNLHKVEQIGVHVSLDEEQLQAIYYEKYDRYQYLSRESHEVIAERRNQLIGAIREIDIVGARLDYEVDTLAARVEDVEDGVEGIERQVLVLEAKAQEFEAINKAKEGWLRWAFRLLTGIGRKVDELS